MRTFTGVGALVIALLMFGTGPVGAQVVSPIQPGHYVPGIINIRDVVTPPPGLYVIWYNWALGSDTYVDRNGNEVKTLNLSQIDPSLPDVDIDLDLKGFATVPAIAWASTFQILGGARYIAAIAPNFFVADAKVVVQPSGPGYEDQARALEETTSGFSDLLVAPAGLSWALGRFDNVTATDEELAAAGFPPRRRFNLTTVYSFVAPTGRYETGADDNLGLGFWTHQFQGFGYFYPFEHQATALMAGLTYELNSGIKDVDVTPGNRLSLEYGLSQYFTPWLEVGIGGAHNWQITDDSGSDVNWDPTVHDRKSTLLFSAGVWPWTQRLYVGVKYGFDYGIRQRFKNNNLMVNFIFIPNVLNGS
jgi:hypothetical protein